MKRETNIAKFYISTRPVRPNSHHACYRCKEEIPVGAPHRIDGNQTTRCCERCIGFYLSRYSFTFKIPNPTPGELAAQKLWTYSVFDKIYKKISPDESPELCTEEVRFYEDMMKANPQFIPSFL